MQRTSQNTIEQCFEFQKPFVVNFIDFKKAFDSIHRDSVREIAKLYRISEKYVHIFKAVTVDCRPDTGGAESVEDR